MKKLLASLGQFPKVSLGHHPTPLERLENFENDFPQKQLFIKRDDCNGLSFGGNKVRQLEYYFGEAKQQGADCMLITGAVQSNFVRLAAAAANKLNMQSHVQLEMRVQNDSVAYNESGNVLINKMLGAHIYYYAQGEDEVGADNRLHEIADELKQQGRRPYVIHLSPGHPPLGALGYVDAACELTRQMQDRQLKFDQIVVPSGSGNTHAGTLFGLRALGIKMPVIGICVRRNADDQRPRLADRCAALASLFGIDNPVVEDDIILRDEYLQPGYGKPNAATREAIRIAATRESLILDPVYSGKTMAGFLNNVANAASGSFMLFWHTGGAPAVFGYTDVLSE